MDRFAASRIADWRTVAGGKLAAMSSAVVRPLSPERVLSLARSGPLFVPLEIIRRPAQRGASYHTGKIRAWI